MDRINLQTRFIILFAAVVIVGVSLYIVWSNYSQQQQVEKEMREKAYVLSQQLDAVWEFMAINQDKINHDANGEYNFKGLHCSLVGKSIGKLFGLKTDYIIRYVNNKPRNPDDVADAFESAAIARFLADRDLQEAYELADYADKPTFRYVVPMKIDQTCLECHGEPAGEKDVLGYAKEGLEIGDLGGVLSIVMPVDIYIDNKKANMIQEIAFFCILMLMLVLIIYYATAMLVTTPLRKLKMATEGLKTGNFDTELNAEDINAQAEIKDLMLHFSSVINELRTLYNELENKVKLRTQDLVDANAILESQQAQLAEINNRLLDDNQYKSEFLAIMSHELRTPLTAIIAFAEVLEKSAQTAEVDDKQKQIMHEIKHNGNILLTLINNILDMARLEAGKTELFLEPVDIVDVINAVDSVMQPLITKKSISFASTVSRDVPIINADREKLRCIVENIVSNAIKFTQEGGKIDLWVDYDANLREIYIHVKDNGIGIGKGHLGLIFNKFVQGDSSAHRPYNGSGLGLSLARELTELHGGKITVESELNKGSHFTVSIPAAL
ncbi:MAG: DUF3365 domain-containing protein [Deferribacteraceae bacterium]|jgi:signal transduction histidine kinase|nr:DUF3365 domain-containing protein [Deferribacteraceae bacterium]